MPIQNVTILLLTGATGKPSGDSASVIIYESEGRVVINSSFGDWSYAWHHRGSKTVAEFICDLDKSYMGGKMLGSSISMFDEEATLKEVKKTIVAARRERRINGEPYGLDKEQAAIEWNRAEEYLCGSYGGCTDGWTLYASESQLEDVFECYCTKMHPDWVAFWDRLWEPVMRPELREYVRNLRDSEKALVQSLTQPCE